MMIYTNQWLNCRLKNTELSQLHAIMEREGMNKSNTVRMLFHIAVKAYCESKKIDLENLIGQEKPARTSPAERRAKTPKPRRNAQP